MSSSLIFTLTGATLNCEFAMERSSSIFLHVSWIDLPGLSRGRRGHTMTTIDGQVNYELYSL